MITSELPSYVPQPLAGGGGPPRRILLGMMVAVFVSGTVIGSGSTLMVVNRRMADSEKHRDPQRTSARIVGELRAELSLDDRQTAQIEEITNNHLAALDRLRREVFFKLIREQFKQMEDQVDAVLDDEQRAEWHAWLEERRQRVCPSAARHNHAAQHGRASGDGAAPPQNPPGEKPPSDTDASK